VRAHVPPDILRVLDLRFGAARPQQQFLFGLDDEDLWGLADELPTDEEDPEEGSSQDEKPAEE
jgi:hypothetical protein